MPDQAQSPLHESQRRHHTTRDLTPAELLLLRLMSIHQFGRIENVSVHDGQPFLDQGVKVVRVARLGGECGVTRSPLTDEFELKQAVRDLFAEMSRLQN